jgi:hypothetical protein
MQMLPGKHRFVALLPAFLPAVAPLIHAEEDIWTFDKLTL